MSSTNRSTIWIVITAVLAAFLLAPYFTGYEPTVDFHPSGVESVLNSPGMGVRLGETKDGRQAQLDEIQELLK